MSRPGEGGDLVIYRRRSLAGPIVATNSEAQTRSIQNVLFINLGGRVPPGYMDRATNPPCPARDRARRSRLPVARFSVLSTSRLLPRLPAFALCSLARLFTFDPFLRDWSR